MNRVLHLLLSFLTLVLVGGIRSAVRAQCFLPGPNTASTVAFDLYGWTTDLSGNSCVVGTTYVDGAGPLNSNCESGAAYVYELVGSAWVERPLIPALSMQCGDSFGSSVTIEGNTLAIGAQHANVAGKVVVYARLGSDWTFVAELSATDSQPVSNFGTMMLLRGGRLFIGSAGAVYVFEEISGQWTQVQKLVPSDAEPSNGFPSRIAAFGDTLVAGAHLADPPGQSGCDSGAAYVFEWNGTTWSETQKLTAIDGHCGDFFGQSVAVAGDVIAVGAYRADIDCPPGVSNCNSGAAYLFRKVSGVWQQEQRVTRDPVTLASFFGFFVALDGPDLLLVSSITDAGSVGGSVVNFRHTNGVWSQESVVAAPGLSPGDNFGSTLAVSGGRVLATALRSDIAGEDAGHVYYYANTPPGVGCDSNFIRGDCNGDGTKNIADAVFTLSFLFPFGAPPTFSCEDACDANDDGAINIADPIALLGSLFGAPTVPLPPPVFCDVDPTPDGLTCTMTPPVCP
ncbi:MAG: hypothetical protein AB7O52_00005 [Planctomycetota bacterium]